MRVVYINYLFDTTESSVGAAVHVRQFVDSARRCGVDIETHGLNRFDGVQAAERNRWRAALKKRLSRYVGELNALLSNIRSFAKEWRIVTNRKPDALLTRYNLFNFSTAVIARLRGIPFVLEVNSPMAYENRRYQRDRIHLPLLPEWIEMLNLQLADRVVVVSNVLKEYFVRRGISDRKLCVVPNGVDTTAFNPHIPANGVQRAYGLENKVVIGFVGSFHYWHGVDNLMSFISRTLREYEDVRFLLVGTGPLQGELQRAVDETGFSGRVQLPGYVSHERIPGYISAMDIVLAPYPAMDFFYFSPLKLYEYMACAKAVVASRLGQIAEMIDDGVNGLLYEPDNLDELFSKCSLLIESPQLRRLMGEKARKAIMDRYTWQSNAESIIRVIEESLPGGAGVAVQGHPVGAS